MAGTGNLILKRGTVMPYNYTQDQATSPTTPVLLKGVPAAQIVGLSQFYATGTGIAGVAKDNYPNRLWIGVDEYGVTNNSSSAESDTTFVSAAASNQYLYDGAGNGTATRNKRPLWMGAEIRAYYPLKEDGGANGDYVVLKADWNKPSDFVLVTQKAISGMPLRSFERNPDPTSTASPDTVPPEVDATREYVEFGTWTRPAGNTSVDSGTDANFYANYANRVKTSIKYCFPDESAFDANPNTAGTGKFYGPGSYNNNTASVLVSMKVHAAGSGEPATCQLGFVDFIGLTSNFLGFTNDVPGSSVALLSSEGATKGKQTFLSPIGIENYLEILPYNDLSTTYPATITSSNPGAASIFDTNITDLSMGGAAEFVEIGNGSTGGNTATTIYGELTVTGPTNLSTDTVIDGGTF